MIKCPYCYEELKEKELRCPHCQQFIIDETISSDFPSIDKKPCIFCGKKIFTEAKICKFCQKWLDEIDRVVDDLDFDDLYE
jgi:predicted amidophosphoribosyltransferase